MYLTSKMLTGHRRETHEHVEAELLLEMYARQLQKIMNECSMIAEKIEATEQQVILLSASPGAAAVATTLASSVCIPTLASSLSSS